MELVHLIRMHLKNPVENSGMVYVCMCLMHFLCIVVWNCEMVYCHCFAILPLWSARKSVGLEMKCDTSASGVCCWRYLIG